MKINNKKAIAVLLIIILLLTWWSIEENQNKKIYNTYRYDLNSYKSNHQMLIISIDTFVDSPSIENYSKIQLRIGVMSNTLISLYKSMRDCYRNGLFDKEKIILYEESKNVVNLVHRIVLDSSDLIIKSIKIDKDQITIKENEIEIVYEKLNSINDVLKPYYEDLRTFY